MILSDQDTKKTGSDAKKTTPLTRITTLATKSEEADRNNEIQQQQVTLCPVCKASYHLIRCWKYKEKSSADKMSLVRAKKLCINCLRPGHFSQKCSSKFTCRVANCGKRHHDAPRNVSDQPLQLPLQPTPQRALQMLLSSLQPMLQLLKQHQLLAPPKFHSNGSRTCPQCARDGC